MQGSTVRKHSAWQGIFILKKAFPHVKLIDGCFGGLTEWLRSSPGKRVGCNSLVGSSPMPSARFWGPNWALFSLKFQRFPVIARAGGTSIDLHRPTETMLKPAILETNQEMLEAISSKIPLRVWWISSIACANFRPFYI